MTVLEIIKSYRNAENKKSQIAILSELNVCEEKEIVDLLCENNIKIPAAVLKKRKYDWKKEIKNIRRMMSEGKRQKEIAEVYGVSQTKISKVITESKKSEEALKEQLKEEKEKAKTASEQVESWKQAAEELAQIIENNKSKEEEGKIHGFSSEYKRIGMGCV